MNSSTTVIFYYILFFLRWLVSQGKIDKALRIMKKFEKFNGKHVDPKIYEEFSVSNIFLYYFIKLNIYNIMNTIH